MDGAMALSRKWATRKGAFEAGVGGSAGAAVSPAPEVSHTEEAVAELARAQPGGPLALPSRRRIDDGTEPAKTALGTQGLVIGMAMRRLNKQKKQRLAEWRAGLEVQAASLVRRQQLEMSSQEAKIRETFALVSSHLQASSSMTVLEADLEESGKEAKTSLSMLDTLEERIKKLREQVAPALLEAPAASQPGREASTQPAVQDAYRPPTVKTTEELLAEELATLDAPAGVDVFGADMPGFQAAHLRAHGGRRALPIPSLQGDVEGPADDPDAATAVERGEVDHGGLTDGLEDGSGPGAAPAGTRTRVYQDKGHQYGAKIPYAVAKRFRDGSLHVRDPFSLQLVAADRLEQAADRSLPLKRQKWLKLVKDALHSAEDPFRRQRPPLAPTNVKCATSTATSVAVRWKAPAHDGGAAITDYEVCFRTRERVQESLNKWEIHTSELQTRRTSRWCLAVPLHFDGCEIPGLPSETEVIDIRVRAANAAGPSDWSSDPGVSAKTKEAHPPSAPLHLCAVSSTHESFTIAWQRPMLGGGRQLRSARIRFVEDVPHWASIVATGDIGAVAPKLHDVVIDWAESHTVRGLKFGSTYRDVTVQAINDKGDTSNPSNLLESVDTMAGTAEQQLRWRIAHAAAEQDDPVDVVYQGFYQRMKKSVYIQALQKELAALGADPEASEVHCETRLGASASEAQQQPVRLKKQRDPDHRSSDLELPPSIRNMTRMRRKHFRLKIEGLEGAIRTAEGAVTELQMRRIRLRAALASSETRLRALKAERKNLASYKGKFVDSAVMHGRSHRHNTDELRAALEDELDKTMDDIALGKQVIIEGMQKEEATAEQVEGLQEQIRQRMAANHEFERSVARYAAQASSVARIVSSASVRAFNQWKEFRDMSKRAKATLLRLVNGALRGMMTEGFASWKRVVFKHRDAKARAEELDNSGAEIVGLGGRLLQKARTDRELAMADLTDMLSGLDHARQSADLAGRSRRQRELMFKAAAGSPLASATPAFSQLERWHMQAKRGGTRAMDPEAEPDGAASQSGSGLASLRKTHRLVAEEVEMLIAQGLALASDPSGDHAKAEQVLRRAEFAVREHGLAAPLARVYRGLTMIYMNADRWDLAAVHADRWNKAAKESDWSTEMLESLETWGRILRKWGHHDAAIVKLEAVLQEYEVLGDDIPVLRVLEELAELYLVTDRADQHAQLRRRAVMLESRDSKRLTDAIKQLQGLEGTLSGTQLKELSAVLLEPVSPIVPALRVQQSVLHSTEKTLKRLLKAAEEFRSARLGRKMLIERRLEQARISGGTVLDVAELDRAAREMARSKAADQKRAASSRRGASSSRPATASESRPATASGSRPATAGSERGSRPPSASGMRGQAIDRGQLMERLQKELDQIGLDVAESDSTLRRLSVRISNCQDDLGDVEDHMRAECNSLAQKVYGATPLRCVAFNEGNFVSNNVRGLGTGGVGKIATCMERVVMAFEMDTGYCTNGFSGASRETSVGPPLGHTSRVVSIAFSGRIIVSGATDWSVRVWDVDQQPLGQAAAGMADAATAAGDMAGMEQDADAVVARALRRAYGPSTGIPASTLPRMPPTHKHAPFQDSLRAAGCMLLLEGHTGAVWSVAVNDKVIVSGGADRRVLVWRLRDGRLLRKLRGHEATVRTISLEGHSFVSGSVEGELRLWDYEGDERNPAEHVTLRRRLIGHEASVTVSSMVGDEIVSGGSDGKVLVWNVDTGEPTRVFPLHRGAVTAMQFDAVKIVTAGTDLAVKVTDIISGRVLQEFASAHEAPVVALQFDLRNLMTASIDHIVKLWKWDDMKASSATREHILRAGEPIARVAKTYKVTIQQIMNWNNVSRLTGFYQGQRILVSEPPETAGMDTLGMVREGRSMLGDEIAEMRGVVQRGIITDKTVGGGVKRLLARAKGHADAAALL